MKVRAIEENLDLCRVSGSQEYFVWFVFFALNLVKAIQEAVAYTYISLRFSVKVMELQCPSQAAGSQTLQRLSSGHAVTIPPSYFGGRAESDSSNKELFD